MKRLITMALLALMSAPVYAGGLTEVGLDDPEVLAPATVTGDWSGPYVGLSYGRNSIDSTSERCFKLGTPKDCNDPIFLTYPEFKVVETYSTSEDNDEFGAFVGYRHDFGRMVGGVELGVLGDLTTAEAQVGLDLGRLLVYGHAGGGQFDGVNGTVYGAGADLKLGKRMMVGAKYTTGDFDGNDVESVSARVAIAF